MTTKEFDLMKAKFVAKYGYSISFPGFKDIVKLGFTKPPTVEEEWAWKNKKWDWFGEERLAELKEYKAKRKKQFLTMLASPTPAVFRDLGAIMTSIDDIQDTAAVLCVIGKALAWVGPKLGKGAIPGVAKWLLGPIGWVLTVADILSVVQAVGRGIAFPIPGKRLIGQTTRRLFYGPKAPTRVGKRQLAAYDDNSPWGKKAKLARARKLSKLAPSQGNLLEIAQVTAQVFGVGICLGPIVGLLSDVMWGTVRALWRKPTVYRKLEEIARPSEAAAAAAGAARTKKELSEMAMMLARGLWRKPTVYRELEKIASLGKADADIVPLPVYTFYPEAMSALAELYPGYAPVQTTKALPKTSPALYQAGKVPKAAAIIMASGYQFDDETTETIALANCLAQEELLEEGEGWNALDHVVNVENTEIMAPSKPSFLTAEAMDETGYPWRETCVWPHNGKPWAAITDIANEYSTPCNAWMNQAMKDHAEKADSYMLGTLFTESHFYTLANLEGEDQVRYEYTEPSRFAQLMLELGFYPDPDQPSEKLELLARMLEDNEKNDRHLSAREYLDEITQNDIALMSWV